MKINWLKEEHLIKSKTQIIHDGSKTKLKIINWIKIIYLQTQNMRGSKKILDREMWR